MERERPQQHHVGVHPQPAMLVEHRVAEEVAEIPDLRAGDDALEQAFRHDVVGPPQFDAVRPQEFELLGRIAPHPHRMPGRPHRCRRGDQGVVLRGVGQHLVEAMDLRQCRRAGAVQERRDPCVEFARHARRRSAGESTAARKGANFRNCSSASAPIRQYGPRSAPPVRSRPATLAAGVRIGAAYHGSSFATGCILGGRQSGRQARHILQQIPNLGGVDRRDPAFAVADSVGDQQALAIGMPGQPGGKFDTLLVEVEGTTDAPQRIGIVEPDKPMLVVTACRATVSASFVDQREPAGLEADRLRAAAELLGGDRRRCLEISRAWSSSTRVGSQR